MKPLILFSLITLSSIAALAQDPCYIKYTYDASGNRIKRTFICAPVDTLILGGGASLKTIGNNSSSNQQRTIQTDFDFTIVPNPVKNEASILVKHVNEKMNCFIYNQQGQVILTFDIKNKETKFNIGNYSNGMYYATINTKNKTYSKKFVKE